MNTVPSAPTRGKLLFVVNNIEFFISHRLSHAIAAQACGYEIHVATPPHPAVQRVVDLQMFHHDIPLQRGHAPFWEEGRTFFALVRLYRHLRPDIVHHVTIKPVLYGSLAARATAVPAVVNAVSGLGYIFIARGLRANARRQIVSMMYRIACGHRNSRVIFQNSDDLSRFVGAGIATAQQAVLIRGAGVNLDEFIPLPEPPGPVTVILASRLLGDKGVREFVEAARLLHANGVAGRYVLVGDIDVGNPTSLTVAEIRQWERQGIIEWWGHRTDMPEVFASSHIVCLPSYQEGLPKVLIEAAACGRPIVSTDVPGCREVVYHEETGLLVPAKTVAPLAAALSRLIGDQTLRKRFGKKARALSAQFDLQRVIGQTLTLYTEIHQSPAPNERSRDSRP